MPLKVITVEFLKVILSYMLSDESEYKTIIISVSIIGALACTYEAVRIYRNNRN